MENDETIKIYHKHTDASHIRNKPGMYLGSTDAVYNERDCLMETEDGFREIRKGTYLPPGVFQVFIEILSNATDNYIKSVKKGIDPGQINVTVEQNGWISVENFGRFITNKKVIEVDNPETGMIDMIPVKDSDKEGKWMGEKLFGEVRMSENYDDTERRKTAGTNGYGAKLTNICSKEFIVEIDDPDNEKALVIIWKDGMFYKDKKARPEVTILKKKPKKGRTKVSYILDEKFFDIDPNREKPDNEVEVLSGEDSSSEEESDHTPTSTPKKSSSVKKKVKTPKKKEEESEEELQYTEDEVNMFACICAHSSFSNKVKINFNDYKFNFINVKNFADFCGFTKEEVKVSLHDYSWSLPDDPSELDNDKNILPLKEKQEIADNPKSDEDIAQLEILVIPTPDNGRVFSYVNGQKSKKGGIHVDAVKAKVFKYIRDIVIDKFNKENKNKKTTSEKPRKKGDEPPKKDSLATLLKNYKNDKIGNHVSLIISARVENPQWTEQTKDYLSHLSIIVNKDSPSSSPSKKGRKKKEEIIENGEKQIRKISTLKYNLPDEIYLKNIPKWTSIEFCVFDLNALQKKSVDMKLKLKDRSLASHKNLTDATYAGKKKGCTLFIVEGDSAEKYITNRLTKYDGGGQSYNGILRIQGKTINPIKAKATARTLLKLANNKEILGLIKALGLPPKFSQGDDIDYSTPESRDKIRYDRIIIAADADTDGYHILGLVIAIIEELYPGLLESGLLYYLATPIIRLLPKTGKKVEPKGFFTLGEFNNYIKENPNYKREYDEPVYCKGLASSTPTDVTNDIPSCPVYRLYKDNEAKRFLQVAFGLDSSPRKEWILEVKKKNIEIEELLENICVGKKYWEVFPNKERDKQVHFDIKGRNVSNLINTGLRVFSIENLKRGLPGPDLFKVSQRYAVYHVANIFKYGKITRKERNDIISSKIAERCRYTHGVASMQQLVFKMMCTYPGSNNMPIIRAHGAVSDRANKKTGQPRYVHANLPEWFSLVFDQESIEFVKKEIAEDVEICPEWIPQVIPMGIINTIDGMGTGWSISSTCYNPIDVCDWFIDRCKGEENLDNMVEFRPFYNGYKLNDKIIMETLHKKDKRSTKKISDIDEEGNDVESNTTTPEKKKEDDSDDDNENEDTEGIKELFRTTKSIICEGEFQVIDTKEKSKVVRITEFPPGLFVKSYLDIFIKQWEDFCETKIPKYCIAKPQNRTYTFDIITGNKISFGGEKEEKKSKKKSKKSSASCDYNSEYYGIDICLEIANESPKNKEEEKKFKNKEECEMKTNPISMQKLRLRRRINLSNIVIVDEKGFPETFNEIHEVAEKYYQRMIEHYQELIEEKIRKLDVKRQILTAKMKFIKATISNKLEIKNVDKDTVYKKLDELGINVKIDLGHSKYERLNDSKEEKNEESEIEEEEEEDDKKKSSKKKNKRIVDVYKDRLIGAYDFNKQGIAKLKEKIEKINEDIKILEETTPQEYWLVKLEKLMEYLQKNRKMCGGEFFCL